ncbi:thioredoxin domain-containing protein [Acidimangrovimonas sediminis]|uniref:thioredoxin family protein n=1 Tax=Acidimangrovimonas sediminis TaxID=2056283 RepID=UPI001E41DC69|nr:thioredoxin family protein [Acidimangrovimonas sediminis]
MLLARRAFLARVLGTVTLSALPVAGTLRAAHAAATGDDVPQGLALVMFQQAGCPWCARWNDEVAPGYPKSTEGQLAPLVRRDIHAEVPAGMALTAPPQFTPTFVLMRDGKELGRIQGYPGADFFWAMLDKLLTGAGVDPNAAPKT